MSWPKRLVAVLFVLCIAAIVVQSLRAPVEPPVKVQVESVRRGSISRSVTAAGKLQPATQIKVSSNLSGDLLELWVNEGDNVHKGQLLARIDARRYAAQVRQQEAVRASASADRDVEKVTVDRLGSELERVRRLVTAASASDAELERAASDLAGEQARLHAAEQRVEQADAALAEARHMLSMTTLYSPIEGVVTSKLKQVGERVRGSDFSEDVILVVATLAAMEVKVEVGEHEVVYLHLGDKAEVEVDALPDEKEPAEVIEIAQNANIKNQGTEAEVTTFFVRLALLSASPKARPGMSAQAVVTTDTHDSALKVPIQAVTARPAKPEGEAGPAMADAAAVGSQSDAGTPAVRKKSAMQKLVFVVDKGVARATPVQVGLANDNEIEVTSGLVDGDLVVVGPYRVLARELKDGKSVVIDTPDKGKDKDKATDKDGDTDRDKNKAQPPSAKDAAAKTN